MLIRSRIRSTAKILLVAMLFAQAAIAAAACDMPVRAPAQAIAQMSALPCHEEPAQNANQCLAHCLSADQNSDAPQFPVPALHAAPALVVPVLDIPEARAVILCDALPHPAPPLRILFQTFLI